MSTTKKTANAAKKEAEVKVAATDAKATATEAKATATEAKATATDAKATAEKKPAAKKETKKATTTKKAATAKEAKTDVKVAVQFADKSYTTEDLVKIANDVWVYDYGKKTSELKEVQLYVKPEEAKVYYVFNGEIVGDFVI